MSWIFRNTINHTVNVNVIELLWCTVPLSGRPRVACSTLPMEYLISGALASQMFWQDMCITSLKKPISLLIFTEEYYYNYKWAAPTYSALHFFGCLGSKIKYFDFGYSFRLFLTFPSQAGNLQSPTVFLFMVMEVKMKSLLLAKGVWIFCQYNCFGQKSNLTFIWE